MTTAQDTTTPSAYRLPDSRLACPWCGCSTQRPSDPALIETRILWQQSPAGQQRAVAEVEMARCPRCQSRADMAQRIAGGHSQAAAALGPDIARERIESALAALVLLGRPQPSERCSDDELGGLLRHVAIPALSLAYRNRALPGTAAPHAWGHLGDNHLGTLRTAWAAVLAERVARTAAPVDLAPPPLEDGAASGAAIVDGACLLCGVGAVQMPASEVLRLGGRPRAARQVWRALTTTACSLKGRGDQMITGHVCPACADAIESAGAVGPGAMERSLVSHLAPNAPLTGPDGPPPLDGLRGYAAVALFAQRAGRARPEPGGERWQHVSKGDREHLAAALRREAGAP